MTITRLIRPALVWLSLIGCWNTAGTSADGGHPSDSPTYDSGQQVADGGASDTWSNYAQGFFAMYCTSCHTVGGEGDPTASVGLDFTQYAQVQSQGPIIRCGTAATQDSAWACGRSPPPSQFPICNTGCTNPKPTDAERARIAAWITAGMPE